MRLFQYAALLVAAVPLTLGDVLPIPDKNACKIGTYRCQDNALQLCVDNGLNGMWETKQQCSATSYCFAQNTGPVGGACRPLVDEDGQCSVIDAHSCAENHLLVCDKRGYLDIVKHCSKTAYCFAQDGIDNGGDCHPLLEGDTQQCSEVDIHRCNDDKDRPAVQVCGEDGHWKNFQACGNTELCETGDAFERGVGCAADPSKVQEKCSGHHRRCNGQTIQDCSPAGTWTNGRVCTSDEACVPNCRGESCSPACMNRSKLNERNDPFVGPPPSLEDPVCTPGIFVCDANSYGLWKCNHKHKWQIAKKCQTPGACVFDGPGRAHCEGPSMDPPAVNLPRDSYEGCKTGDMKCDENFYGLWKCNDQHKWQMHKKCAAPGDCKNDGPGRAHCERGEIDPPAAAFDICKPGDLKCDESFYSLWKCDENHDWKMAKKCAAPGDCKVEGPGRAHCDRGELDPPVSKLSRRASCTPGDLACDKDQRFLFECGTNGQWEAPLQCFGPGYCRGAMGQSLMCAGFPQFDGQNPMCKSHCEAMDYLYCIGEKWNDPTAIAKCKEGMCTKSDCKGCDRCNFRLPYGGKVEPDLTTVVPGKVLKQ